MAGRPAAGGAPAPATPATVGAPSRLGSAPIQLSALRDDALRELVELLDSLPGRILLVVDAALVAPLKLVVPDGARGLREHRVEALVELSPRGGLPRQLLAAGASAGIDTVLYLARPAIPTMSLVAEQVRALARRAESGREARKAVHLAFVPRRTFLAEQALRDELVHAEFASLLEYGLDVLPLDDDVLTMAGTGGAGDGAFATFAAAGDASHLAAVARALLKLQDVFGHIPHIRTKGPHARAVADLLVRARRDEAAQAGGGAAVSGGNGVPPAGSTDARTVSVVLPAGGGAGGAAAAPGARAPAPRAVEIAQAVILDRSVDFVTPFVTPLTFEALLDEVMAGTTPAHVAAEGAAAAAALNAPPPTPGGARPPPPSVAGAPPPTAALFNGRGIEYAMGAVDAALVVDEDDAAAKPGGAAAAAAKPAPAPGARPPRVLVFFNSNDRLFADLRGANVEAAGAVLAARARELAALQESIVGKKAGGGKGGGAGADVSVAEIRKLVKAIPGLQAGLPETYVEGWHTADVVRRMPYRPFGGGRQVSALSLGGSAFAGAFGHAASLDECIEVVHAAVRAGVSMIDTAPWYGDGASERILGKALVGVPRSAYYLHTKVGRYSPSVAGMFDFSRERTLRSVADSLERLGLDYLDCVQVHDPEFAPSLDIVLRETLPALEELRAAGKVRRIGITGYPLAVLRELAARAPAAGVTVDTAVSYCRYNLHTTSLADSGTLAQLAAAGIAVINAAPLSMGLLTARGPPAWHPARPALKALCADAAAWATGEGWDVSRLALAFCLAAPGVATTLVSTASLAELLANVDAATGTRPLTSAEAGATAELRRRFFDPAAVIAPAQPGAQPVTFADVQAWEGVEVDQYWARLGRELMSAHYAALRDARAAGATPPTLARSVDEAIAAATR